MEFMKKEGRYLINRTNEFGTILITPYAVPYYERAIDNYNVRDADCVLFYFMPAQSSDLAALMNKLTGAVLARVLKNCEEEEVEVCLLFSRCNCTFNYSIIDHCSEIQDRV